MYQSHYEPLQDYAEKTNCKDWFSMPYTDRVFCKKIKEKIMTCSEEICPKKKKSI